MNSEVWQEIDAIWRKLLALQQRFDALTVAPAAVAEGSPHELVARLERLERAFAARLAAPGAGEEVGEEGDYSAALSVPHS